MKSLEMIIRESFTDENWTMNWHKEELLFRRGMSKDGFIQLVLEAFKDNELVKLNGEWHRGIGKTTFIANVSNEFNFPIVTDLPQKVSVLNDIYNCKNGIKFSDIENSEQKCRYVLYDGHKKETVDKIRSMGLIALGFLHGNQVEKY